MRILIPILLLGCNDGGASDGRKDKAETAENPLGEIPTDAGTLVLTPWNHASFGLAGGGVSVAVDPLKSVVPASDKGSADLVLVTDVHGDHLDVDGIEKVLGPQGTVVAPAAVADKLPEGMNVVVLANGDSVTIGAVGVEAVAMYNLVRGGEEGTVYHDKGRGNGYILTIDGARIYISGDTECTEEMKALQDIDAAMVCMNLPFTMPPDEAATCVNAFQPTVVLPYHFKGQDPEAFQALVTDSEVRILPWYGE